LKTQPAATVCLTFDLDAVSLWLTTFRSSSPSDLSRGEYGPRVGVPRILEMLAHHAVPATFFVPGMIAELYPETVRSIRDAGHEIGLHGYRHERQVGLGRDAEQLMIENGAAILTSAIGAAPAGFRSPAWELSTDSVTILEDLGFRYDSSMMADDFKPYQCRRGDRIDAGEWHRGEPGHLWEIPVAWELDDFPYFTWIGRPHFGGNRSPAEVLEIWSGEFDYMYERVPSGVFTLTMHPQIIGRGPRVAMLERLISHMRDRPGTRFSRVVDIVTELEKREA
jgi:peptidoglycan/xylan/chitin deacetylase (PgdA/CDA1 family)